MSITAMKQAVAVLKGCLEHPDADEAITALRTAISEAEKQQPVAKITDLRNDLMYALEADGYPRNTPLYLAPPQAQPAPKQEPPPDSIAVNLMRLAGLDKHTARECEEIVRQIYAAPPQAQPAKPFAYYDPSSGAFAEDKDTLPRGATVWPLYREADMATCTWTPMDDDTGAWESACGQAWSFIEDGPVENNCRYCHGCGKPVEVKEQP